MSNEPTSKPPKFRDLPQDLECLEAVGDYDDAVRAMMGHAKSLRYLGQLATHSIRLGYQWGEWEVILTDRKVFEEKGQPTRRPKPGNSPQKRSRTMKRRFR